MPFKTPNEISVFLRDRLGLEKDVLLSEIIDYADKNFIPIILPEAAAFLKAFVKVLNPENTLEIGTAIGYSAQIILKNSNSRLFTIEHKEDLVNIASDYFKRAGFTDRVNIFLGDACEIIPNISGEYDFIFMDGPKTRYIEFLPYLKKVLKKGGVLLCDNVLFNGMVSGENETPKKKQSIIDKLNLFLDSICGDDDFATSLIPLGDGLSLSVKLV